MDQPGDRKLRRALDMLILAVALAITLLGAWVLIDGRHADRYLNADICTHDADALRHECYIKVPVTIDSTTVVRHSKIGPVIPQLTLTWPQATPSTITLVIPQPTQAYYGLQKGETAVLKIWNGVPTALYTASGSALRTAQSPISADELALWGGFSLVGVGLILLVVHPVWWLWPHRFRPHPDKAPTRWSFHAGGTAALFRDPRLRVAMVGLIALNLMDIASSILGGKSGYYEQNPVAAHMVAQWGPLGGFFALKLPALLAIILAITKLPRRIALLVAYAGCVVMIWVVVTNVQLISFGQPPA